METMTPMGAMMLLPSTKEQVQLFAEGIISEVMEGNANPLNVHLQITAIERAVEIIKERIRDSVVTEATKHGKTFELMGTKVTVKEAGVKYDYESCGDPTWERLDVDAKKAIQQRKDREAFLIGIKDHETIVDEQTGEIITVNAPVKTSTTTVSVTFK